METSIWFNTAFMVIGFISLTVLASLIFKEAKQIWNGFFGMLYFSFIFLSSSWVLFSGGALLLGESMGKDWKFALGIIFLLTSFLLSILGTGDFFQRKEISLERISRRKRILLSFPVLIQPVLVLGMFLFLPTDSAIFKIIFRS